MSLNQIKVTISNRTRNTIFVDLDGDATNHDTTVMVPANARVENVALISEYRMKQLQAEYGSALSFRKQ